MAPSDDHPPPPRRRRGRPRLEPGVEIRARFRRDHPFAPYLLALTPAERGALVSGAIQLMVLGGVSGNGTGHSAATPAPGPAPDPYGGALHAMIDYEG